MLIVGGGWSAIKKRNKTLAGAGSRRLDILKGQHARGDITE
jgi:uncharacterized membrane protein